MIDRFLIDNKDFSGVEPEEAEAVRSKDYQRLRYMERYCRYTGCLRKYLLGYFGEESDRNCNNCSNCEREFQRLDMTEQAKSVINCVYETHGRYGKNMVIDVLAGSRQKRIKELGLDRYRTYGQLKDINRTLIVALVDQLIQENYLIQTEEKYSVIQLGMKAGDLHDNNRRIIISVYDAPVSEKAEKKEKTRKSDISRSSLTAVGRELFELLRELRLTIAKEESIPPYVVFSDKTLVDMCVKLPLSLEEMMNVSGVGELKLKKYGDRFLREIIKFNDIHCGDKMSDEADVRFSSKKKQDFCISAESAESFVYSDYYYSGEIRDMLNRLIDLGTTKKISAAHIERMLIAEGYICEEKIMNGIILKTPSNKGISEGIMV